MADRIQKGFSKGRFALRKAELNPAAFLFFNNNAGVLHDFKMLRDIVLWNFQGVGQLADAKRGIRMNEFKAKKSSGINNQVHCSNSLPWNLTFI